MDKETIVEEGLEIKPTDTTVVVEGEVATNAPALEETFAIDDTEEAKKLQEQEAPKFELSADISGLLESIDLPDEFKTKALTIFEAAVAGQVADLHKSMLENNETLMTEYKETLSTKLNEKVDLYLNESANKWIEENQVAIKANLRTQIAESFMSNLVKLLDSHYITIPEGKEDILESSLEKVGKLEEEVERLLVINKEFEAKELDASKKEVFESLVKELTDTQKERVLTLSESIKDADLDAYKTKLSTIIEGLTTTTEVKSSEFVTEDASGTTEIVTDDVESAPVVDTKYSYISDLAKSMGRV